MCVSALGALLSVIKNCDEDHWKDSQNFSEQKEGTCVNFSQKHLLWASRCSFCGNFVRQISKEDLLQRNVCCALQTEDEKKHPDRYRLQVQKTGSLMVSGYISSPGKGNLHFCDSIISKTKIKMFRFGFNTYYFEEIVFWGNVCILHKKKRSLVFLTKAFVQMREIRALDWSLCIHDLSPTKIWWKKVTKKQLLNTFTGFCRKYSYTIFF